MNPAAAGLLALAVSAAAAFGQQPAETPDPLLMQRRLAGILRQARAHYDAAEYDAALERLGVLQGPAARDAGVLNLRGAVLTRMGKTAEAREIFESILASDPSYFPATFNLGEVEYSAGNYERALAQFESMRARDPRNDMVRFKCFACLLGLGRQGEAEKFVAAMIPAGPTPAWYYAQAALALRAGDAAKAEKHVAAAKAIYSAQDCQIFDEAMAAMKR